MRCRLYESKNIGIYINKSLAILSVFSAHCYLFNYPVLMNCVIIRPLVIVNIVAGGYNSQKIEQIQVYSKFLLMMFGLR